MGSDYSTEQENQVSVSGGNLETETPNTAQDIDDKSSRSEYLQKKSDEMQSKNKNESVQCIEPYLINSRNLEPPLLNSKAREFASTEYDCSYNVGSGRAKFDVKYKPSEKKVFIVMPVRYIDSAVLNDGSDKPIDELEPVNTSRSSKAPDDFAKAYEDSVRRVWNNKYKFYLDANESLKNDESCDGWDRITPVEVDVSVKEEPTNGEAYKVYYVDRTNYRSITGPNHVVFSKRTYDNREADVKGTGQNVFTHEFGHQIGLGDEYEGSGQNVFTHEFGHQIGLGDEYEGTEQNVFAHEFGHQIGLGDEYVVDSAAIDEKGNRYEHVYWNAKLKVYDRIKNAVQNYDLSKISTLDYKDVTYDVKKGKTKKGEVFYYLERNGAIINHAFDGTYTSHTEMVVAEFGAEYANKYATMYDDEKNNLGLETSIMNGGNEVKPHHYIPFKKGMVEAIQFDSNGNGYGATLSREAPNMDKDWKIE